MALMVLMDPLALLDLEEAEEEMEPEEEEE